MKLAVLLYGQPRFWDLSYESIIQETTFKECTTDYYFHFWDKISYSHSDPQYTLTDKDKHKIVNIFKPKNHAFTNYDKLKEVRAEIYEHVAKYKQKLQEKFKDIDMQKMLLSKSIFETCDPSHLNYYLGQFVSLTEGAKLITEEYDYIFRIRTDLLFATPDYYASTEQYETEKYMYYEKIYNKYKGIFCKFGDMQIWDGARDVSGNYTDYQPIRRQTCERIINLPNGTTYGKVQNKSMSVKYEENKNYLHMKDWYIIGSGKEMITCIENYYDTIIYMIKKSYNLLINSGADVNWAAGELVCGEVLGLQGINGHELGYDFLSPIKVHPRFLKIANNLTKKAILDRPKIRVLTDSNKSIKDQYKNIIYE